MLILDHGAAVRKVAGMATTRAVDFSSYTRIPNTADIANLKALNVTRAIIGTRGNRRNFVAQAAACLAAGLEVQAYIYVYWNEPAVVQTMNALALIRQVPQITMVWVDVEADEDNEVLNNPRDLIDTMLATLQPYETGIYTSISMWGEIMRDSHAYAHLPLWDANYGSENAAFHAYGGWLQRAMHQYAGSVDVAGLNVDLNTITEGPMTAEERARYDGAITNMLKKLGEVGASAEANTRLLEVLIPPLVSGTPAERFARFIWIAAGKTWTA